MTLPLQALARTGWCPTPIPPVAPVPSANVLGVPSAAALILALLAACSGGSGHDNQPPRAAVAAPAAVLGGQPWVMWLDSSLALDGSGSSDADGDAIGHFWELLARPAGSRPSLSGADSARPVLRATASGDHLVLLTVADLQVQDTRAMAVSVGPSYGSWYNTLSLTTALVDAGPDRCVSVGQTARAAGQILRSPVTVEDRRWTLADAPTGSTAGLAAADTDGPTLVPDRAGLYSLQWTATHLPPTGGFTYVQPQDRMTVTAVPAHAVGADRAARSGLDVALLATRQTPRPDGAVELEVTLRLSNPTAAVLNDAPLHLVTDHGVELLPLAYSPRPVTSGPSGVVTRSQHFIMASGWQPMLAEYDPPAGPTAFAARLLWCLVG